jgi:hypothetical protein
MKQQAWTVAIWSVCLAAGQASAWGEDYLAQLNARLAAVPPGQRGETVLLPAIAKAATIPESLKKLQARGSEGKASFAPGAPEWAEAVAWAQAPTQKAVIDAMDKLTRETDWRRSMTFAQPYGVEGVPLDLIKAGLYVDLGDPPTIAQAKLAPIIGVLRTCETLAWVESQRRAAEGDPAGAIKVLIDAVLISRQFADRSTRQEVSTSMVTMIDQLETIRDIAYTDFRGPKKLDPDSIHAAIQRLDEDGPFGVERIRWPDAPVIAVKQLVDRTYGADGSIKSDVFAATMAKAGASERPLMLFGETAKWREIGSGQADKAAMADQAQRLHDDWSSRWKLDNFDSRMGLAFAYDGMDTRRFGIVDTSMRGMSELFDMRRALRIEAVGTRTALGMYGYVQTTKSFPPTVKSLRPRWGNESDIDPMNPGRELGNKPPMQYFVPIRDTKDQFQGKAPEPHAMSVIASGGENFEVRVGEDQFIIYSVGGDGARNWARRIENSAGNIPNADYLIWPPVESLVRQHLKDSGKIK